MKTLEIMQSQMTKDSFDYYQMTTNLNKNIVLRRSFSYDVKDKKSKEVKKHFRITFIIEFIAFTLF